MRYMMLIYTSETAEVNMTQEEQTAYFQEYMDFTREVRASGQLLGGEALQPTTTATTVRLRDGKAMTTDGPFMETKEQLGGYYIVNCKDLDEAIAWALKIPGAKAGCIEVRPIMEFEG